MAADPFGDRVDPGAILFLGVGSTAGVLRTITPRDVVGGKYRQLALASRLADRFFDVGSHLGGLGAHEVNDLRLRTHRVHERGVVELPGRGRADRARQRLAPG